MKPLPEQYDADATEALWRERWAEWGIYHWDATEPRENTYVIDTPPPTVSGHLHMGHVFSYTQADFIARYQRMTGKSVFYPMGFDDNGLPTERLVEKTIKKRATDMSREEFIAECLKVSEDARKSFRDLFESIALSVDWNQEYHTISDDARRLSQASFLDLAAKGHAYRALRPFYWDPVDQTAIAQAEIVDKEVASFQNVILFEVESRHVPVMTTRPELLPACVALMYHPDDAAMYEGKTARTPLFGVEVPMIADEKVDKDKGTGLVMCCTFGDDTDKEWWEKHKLPTRVILNKYGKIDPGALATIRAKGKADEALLEQITNKKTTNPDPKNPGAREIIIAALKEAGLLTEQTPITHAVKCAERSGAPLEILPTQQWFIRVTDKKEALTARARECVWHPEWMRIRMEQWIEGLSQDWCISRQRYFGVPFPVWYVHSPVASHQSPEIVVARAEDLPVNPLVDVPHGYEKLSSLEGGSYRARHIESGTEVVITPDTDVMDTWATSSISPQLSAGAITNHEPSNHESRFAKLFPADLRPQAHEIIRTWAFYTIVKAHLHNDSVPWKQLMISGWCLAEDKTKMSKSKGNVVTPVELIRERSADAVRYWAATSRLGQDTAFSPDLLKIGRKLTGKLWNATRFAAIHLEKLDRPAASAAEDMEAGLITELLDRWVLSRLDATVRKASSAFAAYEYADALDATNQFFWADFCDNYLELVKRRAYNEDGAATDAAQQSAVRTLYYCLETILKLYAPFVPYVTEELYQALFAERSDDPFKRSIHGRYQWPRAGQFASDEDALAAGKDALEVLEAIRKAKSDAKKSIKYPVARVEVSSAQHYTLSRADLDSLIADLQGAGNVESLAWDHQQIIASDAASLSIDALELAEESAA